MNSNKSILILACALSYTLNCFTQIKPDSLIGTYVGEKWYKSDGDHDWTISIDTAYILSIDTNNCTMEHISPASLPSGTGEFETEYGFCNSVSDNWFSRFHSTDSIFIKYDEVSLPPPDYKLWSSRFYGKKINSNIPTSLEHIKANSRYTFYPNPFQNEINISFDELKLNIVRLVDINGKSIFYEEVLTQNYLIPTNELPSGIYFLQIISNNSMNNFKLIKQ